MTREIMLEATFVYNGIAGIVNSDGYVTWGSMKGWVWEIAAGGLLDAISAAQSNRKDDYDNGQDNRN